MSEAAESEGKDPKAPTPPTKSKKKLFIIVGAVVVLLAGGGGGYMYMQKSGEEAHGEEADPMEAQADAEQAKSEPPNYIEVPEMIVNLRTADGQSRFLKIQFTLSAEKPEDIPVVTARLPAVRDAVQPFLRELRPEDLAGSAAVLRVKEELLRRARTELPPETLKDVLIQTMVQQ